MSLLSHAAFSLYLQEPEIESLAAIESELENVAQKLHELRRGWEKSKGGEREREREIGTKFDTATSSASSSSSALPAAWFPQSVWMCDKICLSAIFPEEARPPQPHSWRSHRVAYSRCTLQLDVHTNNTQVRAYRAFVCVTFQKIPEERRLVQLHFLWQSRLCFCKRISSAF